VLLLNGTDLYAHRILDSLIELPPFHFCAGIFKACFELENGRFHQKTSNTLVFIPIPDHRHRIGRDLSQGKVLNMSRITPCK